MISKPIQSADARSFSTKIFESSWGVIRNLNAIDLEIEQESRGAWYTLYFERATLEERVGGASVQGVVRSVFAKYATKKLVALRGRIALGEVFHPMSEPEGPPGWTNQLDSEPL